MRDEILREYEYLLSGKKDWIDDSENEEGLDDGDDMYISCDSANGATLADEDDHFFDSAKEKEEGDSYEGSIANLDVNQDLQLKDSASLLRNRGVKIFSQQQRIFDDRSKKSRYKYYQWICARISRLPRKTMLAGLIMATVGTACLGSSIFCFFHCGEQSRAFAWLFAALILILPGLYSIIVFYHVVMGHEGWSLEDVPSFDDDN